MGSTDLLVICISAFFVVFLVLTFLALVMRTIMAVFPEKVVKLKTDTAYLAASAASACAAQREIEFDAHRIVEPFGAAPVALADAELEAPDVR